MHNLLTFSLDNNYLFVGDNGRVSNDFCFISMPNVRDAPLQTGEIVMDICHIGAHFISRS